MKSSASKRALQISLIASLLGLIVKCYAFYSTGATTVLADAVESFIHILAVLFVYFGFLVSMKPADAEHLYGHERIEFITVGVEGLTINITGLFIIYESIFRYLNGQELFNLGLGMILIGAIGVINFVLGKYLVRTGHAENNMMVVSNGKHTLTDVWTTAGVFGTLVIIKFTGWLLLDSLVGVILAIFIMYEGFKLLRYSVDGLMDSRNPKVHKALKAVLNEPLPGSMTSYHNLRHRSAGHTTWIELHALFEKGIDLKTAHKDATVLERKLIDALDHDVIVTIHLEPQGSHREAHANLEEANQQRPLDDFI